MASNDSGDGTADKDNFTPVSSTLTNPAQPAGDPTVLRVLEQDMIDVGPGERARTKDQGESWVTTQAVLLYAWSQVE